MFDNHAAALRSSLPKNRNRWLNTAMFVGTTRVCCLFSISIRLTRPAGELRRGLELVKADPQQVELLALFLRHPGDLLSRQQIVDCVWEGRAVGDSVLSVSVAKLRKALGRPGTTATTSRVATGAGIGSCMT
jgi:DNA-binding winged helix-turn-helix (wHTH) protein